MPLPDAVDEYAIRQWIVGVADPFGQSQAPCRFVTGIAQPQWEANGRNGARSNDLALLHDIAAMQSMHHIGSAKGSSIDGHGRGQASQFVAQILLQVE